MATTGAGSPYVVGTDNITTYPTTSLALANRVDAVESGAAAALTSGLAAKYDSAPAINAQTGTTYTFVLADATAGKTITASNAAASTYTVPPQSSATFVAGALLRVTNLGAGVVTFAGGSGVTVTNTAATLRQYQSATLVRTGSDAWTVIADIAPGMDLITPTSVAGSGVTLSGGKVSFTAATAVSVNGVFSTTYDSYSIRFTGMSNSATGFISLRLRVAGADNSTANYNKAGAQGGSNASSVGTGSRGATTYEMLYWTTGTKCGANLIEVMDPALAVNTTFSAFSFDGSGAVSYAGISAGSFDLTTVFDGFSVIPAAGNITGSLRVYGFRN